MPFAFLNGSIYHSPLTERIILLRVGFFLSFISFKFYIFVKSPEYGRDCWPKYVVYVRNKLMSELLCCCVSRINIEDVNIIQTTG